MNVPNQTLLFNYTGSIAQKIVPPEINLNEVCNNYAAGLSTDAMMAFGTLLFSGLMLVYLISYTIAHGELPPKIGQILFYISCITLGFGLAASFKVAAKLYVLA